VENLRAAGVEAEADVYHTDMHAFDMLRDDDLSREAIEKFERKVGSALEKETPWSNNVSASKRASKVPLLR